MADKEISYLDMSDEELANIDPSTIGQAAPIEEEDENDSSADQTQDTETEGSASGASEESEASAGTEADENPQGSEEAEGAEQADGDDKGDDSAAETKGNEESNPKDKAAESNPDEPKIDYEAAYKQLTAPFKANGRDIQVKNVQDAISLMQMGANYNKKMAALKPNLKLMKLLENNGLLNEEKISYLIDLEKKNPDAINKLVKDSGLDPLDLNAEKAGDYKPTRRTIDDREIELDTVLDELQDSPTYNQTLDVVSNKWDAPSKQVIANSPQLLKVIDSHIQQGIYVIITKEIENERLFGRLNGLSDIEAYRQVGDAIQARGGFDHLRTQGQQTQPKPVVVPPKPKMDDEDKRRERRAAASGPRSVAPSKPAAEFNPLSLSDDEFNKIVNKQFL